MPLRRVANAVLSVLLFAAAGLALFDGLQRGMPAVTPWLICAISAIGALGLVLELAKSREHARLLEASTSGLRSLTGKLEESLATVSAMNARIHESEVRYKGLVDAQGDAIFRRSPDSRLTYGNDAFFRWFGLKPRKAIGQPFATEAHPESAIRTFKSFAALEAGRATRALRPEGAHRLWLALDRLGGLHGPRRFGATRSRSRVSAATSPSARRWKMRSPTRATGPKRPAGPSRDFSPP